MKPLSRRTYAIVAILLAAVIFIGLNIGADATFTTTRLDLTQNGQYTLAPGTKNILRHLKEPILLKFFYSKKTSADYAQVSAYAGRVRDLLNEYAALSHGKIRVEEIDPEPFSAAEDQATASGLSGAPTQTGDVVYFGLVGTNTIDGKETIPFFSQDRESFVEYDLTSLVYHLSHPKKPKLGIISSIPLQAGAGGIQAMMQGRSRPYIAYQELSQSYDTQTLERNFTSIPSDIDVLMIVHPQSMNDEQQYAIDQFVLRGGRALVFVDPASEISAVGGFNTQQGPTSSDLPKLFKAWGIGYDSGKVVGDRGLAQPIQSSDPRNPIQPYPLWLHIPADRVAHNDQVTGQLQSLNLASVGALAPIKGASTTFTPLVSSSVDAGLIDAMMVRFNPDPQSVMTQIVPTGHPFTIAARISGTAKTAFPKGPPAPEKPAKTPPGQKPPPPPAKQAPQLRVSKEPVNVIVMADTDLFDDKFWVRLGTLYGRTVAAPFADNGAFILNAVENLTGSGDLISLRTRATNDRPFTVVKKLQAEAQAKFQQQQQALQQRLTDTQQRLKDLQQGGGQPGQTNAAAGISPAQQSEIERFRHELTETRAKIREVQRNLRASVDQLGSLLSFMNIALVPLLVAAFAIVLALLRRRRRARAIAF